MWDNLAVGVVEVMVNTVMVVVQDVVDLVAGIATFRVSCSVTTVTRWDMLHGIFGPREGARSQPMERVWDQMRDPVPIWVMILYRWTYLEWTMHKFVGLPTGMSRGGRHSQIGRWRSGARSVDSGGVTFVWDIRLGMR